MINKKLWNFYKNSKEGKEAIELFSLKSENDDLEMKIKDISNKYKRFLGNQCDEEFFLEDTDLIYTSILADNLLPQDHENSSDYFSRLIEDLELFSVEQDANGELTRIENEPPIVNKQDFKKLCSILPEISIVLYFDTDLFFIPILFREQFDVFIKILDSLEIPIPEFPAKSDKKGRLLLYKQINENIEIFSKENNLTIEETCACIYDFSFMLLEENKDYSELPEPTNIWLTGGSKEDYQTFLQNPVEGEKSAWTCNENTRRGDIIIMYVLSPYSCIQSIWRADIDGIYTPFNYYNSRARVTKGIIVPHISLKELQSDPYFSKLGITRKNFQGVNGVKFSAKDYKELQRLLIKKDFDISILPQLYQPDLKIEENIKNEKDVEERLLIPLLSKLGFTEKDWTRQLSQKAGRKEKAIPDFVFFPKGEIHYQNAPLVIEAKFNMSSSIERTQSYNQAFSYARMMKSQLFGICDKDRIVIYRESKGVFDRFNPIFEKHWQNINDPEIFNKLKLIIGKDVVRNLSNI
ncbi:hypothetical protein GCM10027578_45340 [Spirosoma luteolum]